MILSHKPASPCFIRASRCVTLVERLREGFYFRQQPYLVTPSSETWSADDDRTTIGADSFFEMLSGLTFATPWLGTRGSIRTNLRKHKLRSPIDEIFSIYQYYRL